MAAGLRCLVVIDDARLHLKDEHHRVIFMHGVVAVHGVVPREVAEAEEEGVRLVELEPGDVFSRYLDGRHTESVGAAVAAAAGAVPAAAPSVAAISTCRLKFRPVMAP